MKKLLLFFLTLSLTFGEAIKTKWVLFYFFTKTPSEEVTSLAESIHKKYRVQVIGVIKGILPGERLIDAIKRLNKYQKKDFVIWIDPTLYDLFKINAVPCYVLVPATFAYTKVCIGNQKIIAKRLCGNVSPLFVLEKFGLINN
jgi:hypothetical protein